MMNLQKVLTGELVTLKPLTAADHESLLKAASDPLIWELHPQPDRYKPEVFKNFFEEALKSKGAYVILDKATSEVIGSSRYYDYSESNSSVLIGYTFLVCKCWGGNYNKDLKKLMINYALEFVKTTYFQVGINNIRSQRAMEKIGGTNAGIEEVSISYGPPKKSFIYKICQPLA